MAETGSVVTHFECRRTGERYDLDFTGFPVSGQLLDPQYAYDDVACERSEWERRSDSMWAYRELLPVLDTADIVSLGEGQTPLIPGRRLGADIGVGDLLIKDEGQNPTNTFKDRGASASISGACQQGAERVGLATAGNAGQAASAYAAAAGLECHVYVNHQAGHVQQTWSGLHGAEVHRVPGKLPDAGDAFGERTDLYSVATFQTPFRHEGKKTMGFELFEQLDWTSPDHIVYPTGGGVGLVGIWKAYRDLRRLGWLESDEPPAMHVAQSSGNAPLVDAIEAGASHHSPWADPDSRARGVEVPDPGTSSWVLDIVSESGGTGVAVSDEDAMTAMGDTARFAGVEACLEAGIALAGTRELAADGTIGSEETVVVINTGAGAKSTDVVSVT